jgi:protein-disulfide isomerase
VAQLEAARAETRRLQETLDDPKKLEEYFADKAMREFETAPAQELGLPNTPFKGPEDAPIKVVEFSDFMCPFCRQIAGAFANFLPRSSNRVAIYFKNYPLDQACNPGLASTVHAGACNLALGAVCAQEQGKFWPYHDKVFGSQLNNPQTKDVVTLAGSAGLDSGAFETCLGSQKAKDRLAAEIQEGVRGGVKATPTLFINGKRLPRVNDFLSVLDKEAARLGLPPLSPQQAN